MFAPRLLWVCCPNAEVIWKSKPNKNINSPWVLQNTLALTSSLKFSEKNRKET